MAVQLLSTKLNIPPTRPELVESTIVIIISVVILGAFVGASDGVLTAVINLLLNAG